MLPLPVHCMGRAGQCHKARIGALSTGQPNSLVLEGSIPLAMRKQRPRYGCLSSILAPTIKPLEDHFEPFL
jgi:hypothetical protein